MKMLGPSSKTHCISHQVWPLWIVSFLIFPPISVYSHTCNPLKQVNTVRGESSLLPSQKHLPHSFSYSHAAILSKITISKMTCHLLILDKSFTLPLVLPRAVYSFILACIQLLAYCRIWTCMFSRGQIFLWILRFKLFIALFLFSGDLPISTNFILSQTQY